MLKPLFFSMLMSVSVLSFAQQATTVTSSSNTAVYNPAMATVPQTAIPTTVNNTQTTAPTENDKKTVKESKAEITADPKADKAKVNQIVISKENYERYQALEKNNLEVIAKNQELQMQSDNLAVQVQVLQNERTAQLLFYGAMIALSGAVLGFLVGYFFARRQRPYR